MLSMRIVHKEVSTQNRADETKYSSSACCSQRPKNWEGTVADHGWRNQTILGVIKNSSQPSLPKSSIRSEVTSEVHPLHHHGRPGAESF